MLAAALILIIPGYSSLKVSAASPTTFYVFLDKGQWYYQVGVSDYDESYQQYEVETIMTNSSEPHPKDGDSIVLEALDSSSQNGCVVNVNNVNLQNVTVVNTAPTVIVKAASINECYVLCDGNAAINGNVSNAYVYDRAHANFNNNVTNLYISAESDDDAPVVKVEGTVDYAKYTQPDSLQFEYYHFVKGAFELNDGKLQSNTNYYQSEGDGPAATNTAASDSAVTNTQSSAAASSSSASDEYDKVPKTGEALPVCVWFFSAAAVCFAGSRILKRI